MQRENPLALIKIIMWIFLNEFGSSTTQLASKESHITHTKRKHIPINKHTPFHK
jgi:hypothetical protein